jgi:hypothetical protein
MFAAPIKEVARTNSRELVEVIASSTEDLSRSKLEEERFATAER